MKRKSIQVGGLVGPTIIAIIVSEFPLIQPHLYDAQIPPVVYLSGTLFFVGGLAVVRTHNYWKVKWSVLITLSGWCAILLGLVRMLGASAYLNESKETHLSVFITIEIVLFLIGSVITYKSYFSKRS